MATITEDYVSFQTAKLLKEKGFNEETEYVYSDGGELLRLSHLGIKDLTNANCNDYHTWRFPIEGVASIISTPTIQMAMKWLRKVYKIDISVYPYGDYSSDNYQFDVYENRDLMVSKDDGYMTYEQACESAIKYCLKHLI